MGRRFVKQVEGRLGRQRPCQADPLLLTTGQLIRQPVRQIADSDKPQQSFGLEASLGSTQALPQHGVRDRVDRVQMRPERIVLEHHADCP